jgi:hypothetical protein
MRKASDAMSPETRNWLLRTHSRSLLAVPITCPDPKHGNVVELPTQAQIMNRPDTNEGAVEAAEIGRHLGISAGRQSEVTPMPRNVC